jgi:hypothetical protein
MWRSIFLFALLSILLSASGHAAQQSWEGTLEAELSFRHDPIRFLGSGIADVTYGSQLEAVHLAGGISGSATIPLTDPLVTGQAKSIRVEASLGTGDLSPFSPIATPQLTNNSLPLNGGLRVCLFAAGCDTSYLIPFASRKGEAGVGLGGSWTFGGFGAIRISIESAPWTFLSASVGDRTDNDGTTVIQTSGFIHGPVSWSGSAGLTSGILQLVAPVRIRDVAEMNISGFVWQTIRFVPEPEVPLLLASGAVGLLVLGRHRARS